MEPEEYDRNETYMAMTMLDKYHGQANGIHGCDEHLAGSNPSRGSCVSGYAATPYHTVPLVESVCWYGLVNS